METIKISKCCGKEVWEQETYSQPLYVCKKCKKYCKVEEVCAFCLGTGEVETMEQVYPGEPHMAPIGTQKCVCQIKDDGEIDQDR